MFYEFKNSLSATDFKIEEGTDFSFPDHLHSSFEFITVTEGELEVTVDKKHYSVRPGNGILIFPNQVHSLLTIEHSAHLLCIFSPKLVAAYNKVYLSKLPVCAIFYPKINYADAFSALRESASPLTVKGLLYTLCGEFDNCAEYVDRDKENASLLVKIFTFVENNFAGECDLSELSRATSYHYVYLSKLFKEAVGTTFTEYVCRYRISEACYILQNTDQPIIKTAYECGFNSLRSFNRNFKRITGKTPSEYRQKT